MKICSKVPAGDTFTTRLFPLSAMYTLSAVSTTTSYTS